MSQELKPLLLPSKKGPEAIIQEQLIVFLEKRGWVVKPTHGSMFQSGFPDLYATHKLHGGRWIEVKLPEMKGSKFTKAQEQTFPAFSQNGTPIWILTAATESEYKKLFQPENWLGYFVRKM